MLLVDVDPQGSLTISMGLQDPDQLPTTLSTLMQKAMHDQPVQPGEGVLHHAEGVDLIPANIELAGMEVALVNSMNREKMLKQVLDSAKREYDYILLDCTPSLGMLTVNALAAADTTLIPMQAQFLSAKGLEQLLQTIGKVRRQINPKLKIEGILNQKKYLEDYARKNGFNNIQHFTDDGYSGTNFNRPGFQSMIAEIEAGHIATVIVKDMSRFGRNYLEVGFYTEIQFPSKGVRFIAINNNVDSANPTDNDFTPFLNIMNEWYAKDTSNKIRAVFKSRIQPKLKTAVQYSQMK